MSKLSETSKRHKEKAPKKISFGVLTVSTSRFHKWIETGEYVDESGDLFSEKARENGHSVILKAVLPDDRETIKSTIKYLFRKYREQLNCIVLIGGTGVSPLDVSIESVREIADKEIEGFGEFFRAKSLDKIGTSAILTRAGAFTYLNKLIYVLPGSPDAVSTAIEFVFSETGHILAHLSED